MINLDYSELINLIETLAKTTQERSYLQTFPDDFIWEGSKTNLEQMIGNAVPVKLAEYVANAILDYFSKSNIIQVQQLSLPIF